jgi:DNA repair protein RadA/Sms
MELSMVAKNSLSRTSLGFVELDRVLGGGLVPGSLVLIGGEPGIGKSTLLLQASARLAERGNIVAYISGEESVNQVKLRAERLNIKGEGIYFLSESNLQAILDYLDTLSSKLVVVDSIQTMYIEDGGGIPGSISQVRECTLKLEHWAKQNSVPIMITGHVTKEGAIAGPGTLEHIVDAVLYFEGDFSSSNYRLLRGVKNRFGSTNEIGIFEMRSTGFIEVSNPSQFFLSSHKEGTVGSVIVPTLEGSRPFLVKIQALATMNNFSPPKRIANGVDFNRLLIIIAVLSKHAGLKLFNQDIIVNVTGGLKISEPAVDLGISLAIASSFRECQPVSSLVVLGEVGLDGEIRIVPQMERRLSEASRLGFESCLLPELSSTANSEVSNSLSSIDINLMQANNIKQALHLGLIRKNR